MNPSILALGKSVPSYSLSQTEIADRLSDLLDLQEEESWLLRKIYANSAISKRYSVLPDIIHPKNPYFSGKTGIIGMSKRNGIYKKEAPLLAERAAREALRHWPGMLNEITHVISVSCTGAMTPGIEFFLMERLGLEPYASLLGINFLGCYGAFKALKVAKKIAQENSKNRILLVSTELCTLHFKCCKDIESMVIQSLFADGSAAVIIGKEPRKNEISLFELVDDQSFVIKDSFKEMTWDASDEGFDMTLSARVPKLIGEYIESFVKRLIGASADLQEYEWAIHPGGKAIIEAVELALKLDRSQAASSWTVLKHFGNLSSATFLYVLEDIYQRQNAKEKILGLGFGPGLSVEGIVLQKTRRE
jgi:predicted naringenin-chalcone synthase